MVRKEHPSLTPNGQDKTLKTGRQFPRPDLPPSETPKTQDNDQKNEPQNQAKDNNPPGSEYPFKPRSAEEMRILLILQ